MRFLFAAVGLFLCFASTALPQQPLTGSARTALPDDARRSFSAEVTERGSKTATARTSLEDGNKFFKNFDYKKAIEAYRAAIALDPSYFQAHYNLGIAFVDARQYRDAQRAFEQALALKDDSAAVLKFLGSIHYHLDEFEIAAQYFTRRLAIDHNSSQAYSDLGGAQVRLGQYQEAQTNFDSALQLEASSAEALTGLCLTFAASEQDEKAVQACEKASRSASHAELPLYLFGKSYLNLRFYDKALAPLSQAAELKPRDGTIQDSLALAYFGLERYQDAMVHFRRAVESEPNLAEAYTGMGSVYLKLKNYRDAKDSLTKALGLDPASSVAHMNLALTCLELNQRDCALEQYNILQRLDPTLAKTLSERLYGHRLISVPQP